MYYESWENPYIVQKLVCAVDRLTDQVGSSS